MATTASRFMLNTPAPTSLIIKEGRVPVSGTQAAAKLSQQQRTRASYVKRIDVARLRFMEWQRQDEATRDAEEGERLLGDWEAAVAAAREHMDQVGRV